MQQGSTHLAYEVFDLLEADGESVVDLPLTERRARLERLLARNPVVQLSGSFEDGEALLEAAREQGLEGVMAKRAASRYQPGGRGRDWLKIKTHGRQEFVICGYTKGQGRRSGSFGALVLGVHRGVEWEWVGNVGTGFGERAIASSSQSSSRCGETSRRSRSSRRCRRCGRATSSGSSPSSSARSSSRNGRMTATFARRRSRGFATTSRPQDVRRERPAAAKEGRVKLSNLDKIFWPDEGITKGDLLDYYAAVASVLVPHLRDRPFTMRRYPDGAFGKAFFQKDAPKGMPEWIPRFRVQVSTRERPPKKRWIDAPLVNDEDTLLWMVNMGCIDMNAWYSRVDRPDRPDFVLFDLDPSPDVGFREVVQVALLVKQALDALGLVSFPKTIERRRACTCSCRWSGATRTRRPASSARSWRERSRAPIAGLRRRSGRRRSGAASSSTRTRTAKGRRSPRSTPCVRGRARPCRRRCGGTSSSELARRDRVHDGGRARADPEARRPLRGRADDETAARACVARTALSGTQSLWAGRFSGTSTRRSTSSSLAGSSTSRARRRRSPPWRGSWGQPAPPVSSTSPPSTITSSAIPRSPQSRTS